MCALCAARLRRAAGETEALEAWPEAASAAAATAASGGVPPSRAALPLADWARTLLQHVTITIVPVEARRKTHTRAQTHACALASTHALTSDVFFVPIICVFSPTQAPSARRAVEGGALCRRKTLREVDLNRNWGAAWRSGSPRGGDEYGGTRPFSEPTSRALRQLATALRPTAYVNVHSGEWAMYVPWDHKKARDKRRSHGPHARAFLCVRMR